MAKRIITSYVTSGAQLGVILTKALFRKLFLAMCTKLRMIDIYTPA